MLIKSIDLENFRIFSGKQHIDFSTDKHNNVTVIMGDNGAGKTTLAQAFSWCLYGTTTFKKKDELLSIPVRERMADSEIQKVSVSLKLVHNGREYSITRYQEYRKEKAGGMKAFAPILSVSYRADDGQTEPVTDEEEKKHIVNEIVPSSISSYFFFDGERVERMGKEIQEGRSKEFKVAVDNLLGLSAISSAMKHLSGGQSAVIGSYAKDYNANSDREYRIAVETIAACDERIAQLEMDIAGLEEDKADAELSRDRYNEELVKLAESRQWAEERKQLNIDIGKSEDRKAKAEAKMTESFGRDAWTFFISPLLAKAREAIDSSSIDFQEAPSGITADTIQDIIERKKCICGAEVTFNSTEYTNLISWLAIVPPEHLGAAIKNYQQQCNLSGDPAILRSDIDFYLGEIRTESNEISLKSKKRDELSEKLAGAKDSSGIEHDLKTATRHIREVEDKIGEKHDALGMAQSQRLAAISDRDRLTVHDDTNRRIQRETAYAEYIYDTLKAEHLRQEAETRIDLEAEINKIFQEFFSGNLELELDEHYNVTVRSRESQAGYEVETSEGQTVAVIFAFIAGVIRLAADSKRLEDDMLLTESYPLVMDAPMSKLDKKRIEAICEVVPKIAEQTIIMIKDTDGELAKDYLRPRIGVEYEIVSIQPERESKIERK